MKMKIKFDAAFNVEPRKKFFRCYSYQWGWRKIGVLTDEKYKLANYHNTPHYKLIEAMRRETERRETHWPSV